MLKPLLDENMKDKAIKVLGHILWLLEEAQKPVEASQTGVKRVRSMQSCKKIELESRLPVCLGEKKYIFICHKTL